MSRPIGGIAVRGVGVGERCFAAGLDDYVDRSVVRGDPLQMDLDQLVPGISP